MWTRRKISLVWRVIENPLSDGCDDEGLQLKYAFMCCSWAERYFGRCVIAVWQSCGKCCVQMKGVPRETLFNDCRQQLANTSLSPHRRIGADILMMTMLWAEITKRAIHQLTAFKQPLSIPAASLVLEKVKIIKSKAGAKENVDCCSSRADQLSLCESQYGIC